MYKIYSDRVRKISAERGIHPVHALNSLLKNHEKHLGRLFVKGVRTALKNEERLSRKHFQRYRDFKSYKSGYLNGKVLGRVFLNNNTN